MNEVDQELIAIYVAEHREHAARMRELLDSAVAAPPAAAAAVYDELLRRAHTLKGASRAVGYAAVEALAHAMETLFAQAKSGAIDLGRELIEAVRCALDASEDAAAAAVGGRGTIDVKPALDGLQQILHDPAHSVRGSATDDAPPPQRPAAAVVAEERFGTVRVRAEDLDRLLRSSSQVLSRVSAEETIGESLKRLRREIGEVEATQDGTDRRSRLSHIANSIAALETAQQRSAWSLEQAASQLEQDVIRVRLVPAEAMFAAFANMVRELAREERKEVGYRAEGLDTRADRMILEALKDPVMHLLRNAVSHGIERPEDREAKGKPRTGRVLLRAEARQGRLELTIEDDGRGLDWSSVAAAAVRTGLLSETDAKTRSPEQLFELLALPGFTTAERVTRISGRGIGLSVVQNRVRRLQGEWSMRPLDRGGLLVRIAVPLAISTHHVALVSVGPHRFAIPTRGIERLCRIDVRNIVTIEGRETIDLDGHVVPLTTLAALLGLPAEPAPRDPRERRPLEVMVLRAGTERVGAAIDAVTDTRDAVVADLPAPASKSTVASGGIVLEDGTVAVVLDTAALIAAHKQWGRGSAFTAAVQAEEKPATILVVDDSITTRALEKSILEAHGYNVRVAVDGIEALEALRAGKPDLVIADVLMPRLDGFGLLEAMKKDRDLADVPVIIVSSLERPEEQQRGLDLGAGAYIVKRKFDQRELLDTVRQVI